MTDENNYSYSLILITDGGESCGGDICAVARELLAKKIFFKPYILSLVDYAPLRQQYDCLGQYLQVTKDADLPVAVGTIVDAYRKSLILAKASNKEVKTTPVPISVPSVLHIPAPPVTLPQREPEDVPAIQPSKPAASAPATPVREQPKPVAMEPLPRIINREELARIATVTHMHLLPLHFGTTSPQPLKIPPMPPVKAEPEPVAATLPPAAPPSRPPAASAPPKVTPKPTVIRRAGTSSVSASPDPTKPLEAEYTATAEQAQESAVEVYFTDGKGNFYKSAPQLLINDAKTGKNQKKFYRSVDALGNPEPEPLAPGTYNIVVAGRTNLVAKNVTINPNEKKKVYIKVGKSTIRFRYEGNPNRPVTEFEALISKLFEPGPAIRQHCTAELEYEPGTYRIEINTVPVTRYSLDIEFNASYFVTIDEPGYVQFTNQNAIGKVSLYHPLNDAFVRFLSVNITGNPQDQKVQLQPGLYEAHWVKDPSLPYASESIVRFQVRSNDVTNTELQ